MSHNKIAGLVFGLVFYVLLSLLLFVRVIESGSSNGSCYSEFVMFGKASLLAFGWVVYVPLLLVAIPMVGVIYVIQLPCHTCISYVLDRRKKHRETITTAIPVSDNMFSVFSVDSHTLPEAIVVQT